ncbi:MAG: alanine dehydrogenase [Methyloprofundus sp.]|nr:MAG: alanine dehydrogenase [Methyloprofundus sp.]
MIIGVPKEIKNHEYRVGMIPEGAARLVRAGHRVVVEVGAGIGSGFIDTEYQQAGAVMVSAQKAWEAQLVVKVKEPLTVEFDYLQGQMLFTFLHLAGVGEELTDRLVSSGTTAIAYETLEDNDGRLPILAPMSAIAGNMAALMGQYYLAKFNQGSGVQLGKVLGECHGKALVIGDGVVGFHAARTLNSMGANVVQVGLNQKLEGRLVGGDLNGVEYYYSTAEVVARLSQGVDLVVGAVLRKGRKSPYVLTKDMLSGMRKGSVVVDVSIDQGGCIEGSRPTTHDDPVYVDNGIIHYCVANMPGAYPRTATVALCMETIPYIVSLANCGVNAFFGIAGLAKAINIYDSRVVNEDVAASLGYEWFSIDNMSD